MAGGIFGPNDSYWGVNSSVFYWTVKALAEESRDPALKARLEEVFDNDLGGFDVDEFSDESRAELVRLIRRLPDAARERYPPLPNRVGAIERVEELAEVFATGRDDEESEVCG